MENLSVSHVITGLSLALSFGGMTFFSAVMAPLEAWKCYSDESDT